jgi:hypothetical protein
LDPPDVERVSDVVTQAGDGHVELREVVFLLVITHMIRILTTRREPVSGQRCQEEFLAPPQLLNQWGECGCQLLDAYFVSN